MGFGPPCCTPPSDTQDHGGDRLSTNQSHSFSHHTLIIRTAALRAGAPTATNGSDTAREPGAASGAGGAAVCAAREPGTTPTATAGSVEEAARDDSSLGAVAPDASWEAS